MNIKAKGMMHKICFLELIILLLSCELISCKKSQKHDDKPIVNHRPIIGIVTQKCSTQYTPKVKSSETYIASSYVKHLESAGAQVVPILSTYSKKKVLHIVNRINGVLFPGGAAPLDDSNYANVAKWVFEKAKEFNDDDVYYPLWGTCLGFEALNVLGSGDKPSNVLSQFDAENMPAPVNFTLEAFRSRMFKNFDLNVLRGLMFSKLSLHMHNMGVSSSVYGSNPTLQKFYKVLGLNTDRQGKEFVSIIEGVKYPFYGTQFHPEKNLFEWTRKEPINHSFLAIKAAQSFANFFVNEARKNDLRFETFNETEKHLMFRYQPVYSGGSSLFEQVYIFDRNGPDEDTKVVNG